MGKNISGDEEAIDWESGAKFKSLLPWKPSEEGAQREGNDQLHQKLLTSQVAKNWPANLMLGSHYCHGQRQYIGREGRRSHKMHWPEFCEDSMTCPRYLEEIDLN